MARLRKHEIDVVKKRLKGQSKTNIAKELGISRTTVHAILDKTQTEEVIVKARSRLLLLADPAIDRVKRSIKSPKRDGLKASLAVLKGVGVMEERTKSRLEVESGFESMSDEQLKEFISEGTNRTGNGEEGTGTQKPDKTVHWQSALLLAESHPD
jgi:DNA-binding Lrp family transcriptional regulator